MIYLAIFPLDQANQQLISGQCGLTNGEHDAARSVDSAGVFKCLRPKRTLDRPNNQQNRYLSSVVLQERIIRI